jgi:signal transduction histidine kinase
VASVELTGVRLSKPLSKVSARLIVLLTAFAIVLATGVTTVLVERGTIESRNWVVHTYEVRHELSALEIARATSRANALAYLLQHRPDQRPNLDEDAEAMREAIKTLRGLLQDNPAQAARAAQLEPLINQQITQLNYRLEAANSTAGTVPAEVLDKAEEREAEIGKLMAAMRQEEQDLLQARLRTWSTLFRRGLITVGIALAVTVFLLFYSFSLLSAEVSVRREMERLAQENMKSYRALSGRILELQDIERRKIARELHDSVGQFLAGLKMNLGQLASGKSTLSSPNWLPETLDMTNRAIGEIRTISHLLHPPLLDELGFESSAKWFVDEFAKRSGTKVSLEISGIVERLPRGVELALFRVLQESLTNVHRHAKARKVDVVVTCGDGNVILQIADDGNGIPPRIMQQFQRGGAAGIGLAGMRERVAELQGALEVESTPGAGTRIRATLPTTGCDSDEEQPTSDYAAAN